jgi:hypothetical protein
MKHIKTYKLFESLSPSMENIVSTIKDILLELDDDGYNTSVRAREPFSPKPITVEVGKSFNVIEYDREVKEVMSRVTEFLSKENYTLTKHNIKYTDLHIWEFRRLKT